MNQSQFLSRRLCLSLSICKMEELDKWPLKTPSAWRVHWAYAHEPSNHLLCDLRWILSLLQAQVFQSVKIDGWIRWSLRTLWVLIFGAKFHMPDTCLQCLPPSLHAHPWLSLLGTLLSECGLWEEGSGLQESLIAAYAGCLATPPPHSPSLTSLCVPE